MVKIKKAKPKGKREVQHITINWSNLTRGNVALTQRKKKNIAEDFNPIMSDSIRGVECNPKGKR